MRTWSGSSPQRVGEFKGRSSFPESCHLEFSGAYKNWQSGMVPVSKMILCLEFVSAMGLRQSPSSGLSSFPLEPPFLQKTGPRVVVVTSPFPPKSFSLSRSSFVSSISQSKLLPFFEQPVARQDLPQLAVIKNLGIEKLINSD